MLAAVELTHVIVDRHLQYKNVLNILKVDEIPVSNDILIHTKFLGYLCKSLQDNIKVVNEHYPGDCLHYRRILDTTQPIYEVPGKPVAAVKEPSPVEKDGSGESQEDSGSHNSLPIKPVEEKAQEIRETQRRYGFSKGISCLDIVVNRVSIVEMLTSELQCGFRGAFTGCHSYQAPPKKAPRVWRETERS